MFAIMGLVKLQEFDKTVWLYCWWILVSPSRRTFTIVYIVLQRHTIAISTQLSSAGEKTIVTFFGDNRSGMPYYFTSFTILKMFVDFVKLYIGFNLFFVVANQAAPKRCVMPFVKTYHKFNLQKPSLLLLLLMLRRYRHYS